MITRKSTIYFIIMVFILTLCYSCQEEPVSPTPTDDQELTIKATTKGANNNTKLTIDANIGYWDVSDKISVFYKGASACFVSQNTSPTEETLFKGAIEVNGQKIRDIDKSFPLWGVYPYNTETTCDGESITTDFPSSGNSCVWVACSNANDYDGLAFSPVASLCTFELSRDDIRRIEIKGNNGESLAGKIKIRFANSRPVVETIDCQTTIVLSAPGNGTFSKGMHQFFFIPTSFEKGITLSIYREHSFATISTQKTIREGTNLVIGTVDSVSFYDDENNPPEKIQFEDPIAKYACLEKYDLNKDGEISTVEAENVRSLEGLFKEWETVKHFDEIRYFSNVTSTIGVFDKLSKLESITIPDNITTLGTFSNCSALKAVTLPATIKALPSKCFSGCISLENVDSIIKQVAEIGNGAFENCYSLASVSLPNCSIGNYAFSGCSGLMTVNLATGISSIPDGLFKNCDNLTSISWPNTIESIGNHSFEGCNFSGNNYSITLPSSVKTIGSKAFDKLHHIIIPSDLPVSIERDSFSYSFLYVPSGLMDVYKEKKNWREYSDKLRPIEAFPAELAVGGEIGEAVDLGLPSGLLWASWNLGASSPEEFGDYFAWGETNIKWEYDWASYKWCNGSYDSLTKYNDKKKYGFVDNKPSLDLEDDAAHVNWGGKWHMPSINSFKELYNNCKWKPTTINGVQGFIVSGVEDGFTNNSIFLPATISTHYWANSIELSSNVYGNPSCGDCLEVGIFTEWTTIESDIYERCAGCLIRPVCYKE